MNQYITGTMIRQLREKNNLTQAQLAGKLAVSDKTVSKWETGKGYPDITLLEPLAEVFHISIAELLAGTAVENANVSANMMRAKFYICPVCGNIIHSMGEAVITCHGIQLCALTPEEPDEHHQIQIECVEDEYFVTIDHEMTKQHHISFLAAVTPDRVQIVKLYPEGEAQARFKRSCVKEILVYCNKDGLFKAKVVRKRPEPRQRMMV